MATFCEIRKMPAMDKEWIRDRLKKTGKSQRGLAEILGRDPSVVTKILKGEREIKASELPKIEKYFEVEEPTRGYSHAPDVTPTPPPDFLPRDIPVREGALCGEDGALEFESQIADYMPRPPRLAGVRDAYALYMRDDSMIEWKRPGQLIYIHPGLPLRPADRVVVQLKPKAATSPPVTYVKELVSINDREVHLLQYNPRKSITVLSNQILCMHRVLETEELIGA